MNRLFRYLNLLLLSFLVVGTASAAPLVLETQSLRGQILKLTFPTSSVTTDNEVARLCPKVIAQGLNLASARLWMPSMGHGSTPVRLTPVASSCVDITQLNFVMDGDWELQVTLRSGDKAVFDFNVAYP